MMSMEQKSIRSDQQLTMDRTSSSLDDQIVDNFTKILQLKKELANKEFECQELNVRLQDSERETDKLNKELVKCKTLQHETNEYCQQAVLEASKFKKLEEEYNKLFKSFLSASETNESYKQELIDVYTKKSVELLNIELSIYREVESNEVVNCRKDIMNKVAQLEFTISKNKHLEDQLNEKDNFINALKHSLENAKVAHEHVVNVMQEYINSLKNTVTSYEQTLALYSNVKREEDASQKDEPPSKRK